MKAINKFLFLLGVLCLPWGASAHQPDLSSTILVEQDKNKWVLQVRAALTAFEYVVEANFGESSYATPEEFQALVANYVRENTTVRFNDGQLAVLQDGVVKLGHETYVTFQIEGTPDDVQSLVVQNTSFSDISRNQSALLILKKGVEKEQFTLNNNNEHRAELEVRDARFVLVVPNAGLAIYLPFLLLIAALLVLSLVYFALKKGDRKLYYLR
jgi:hypothetical protein